MIRVIVMSNENGSNETVVFTDDMEASTEDFLDTDQTVDSDSRIVALPSGFPLNYILKREG